jgi:H+/Cl- antiporter ClcA
MSACNPKLKAKTTHQTEYRVFTLFWFKQELSTFARELRKIRPMLAFVSLLRGWFRVARAELLVLILSCVMGVGCGVACAIFLFGLNWCTHVHQRYQWLVWALAPAGFALGSRWTCLKYPSAGMPLVQAGLEGREIPIRLLPAVLLGTTVINQKPSLYSDLA